MDFTTYLQQKKIDAEAFRTADPHQWATWKKIFDQVHPDSFTAQKLYLINPLRRLFPYEEDAQPQVKKEPAKKPLIKPKPQVPKNVEETKPVTNVKPKMQVRPKIGRPGKMIDKSEESNKPAGMADKPAGMADKPAGMADKPAGMADMADKPAGMADKPAKKPRPVIKRSKKD